MLNSIAKEKRSQIMSKIKSKNTLLELKFKDLLAGLRFRHQPKIKGKPDFALNKCKIAIFIDSCFWHKCPKHFRQPSSNKKYWIPKINRNVERAKEVNKDLRKAGWKVLRFWEHKIKENPEKCLFKIKKTMKSKEMMI